jgi:hypothetical protein
MTNASIEGDVDRAAQRDGGGGTIGFDAEKVARRHWRNWLSCLISLSVAFNALLYSAVVLVDPFSTGRFSLTQRIDFVTSNTRLASAGLVRDPQFNGAIIGDSVAFPLDPAKVAGYSGWRIAQLAVPAATPANMLIVARAFERHHRATRTLQIFVLSNSWCRSNRPEDDAFGWFPDWLYESTDQVYLSRIFFSDAIDAMVIRVGIWLGLAEQTARADGYAPVVPHRDLKTLLTTERPTSGPPPDAPFPAIDALISFIASLSPQSPIAFVFAPPYIRTLPADDSIAAARLLACKDRIRKLAIGRPHTAYLDLMTDNSISRDVDNFADPVHFTIGGAHLIEPEIALLIKDSRL